MSTILGIDIGTSSLKAMLLDPEKGILAVRAKAYEVSIPKIGYAEQDPATWWDALKDVLAALKESDGAAYEALGAIGFSGQMHGLVLAKEDGAPVRPAILWLDQRSREELRAMEAKIAGTSMAQEIGNRISSGFAFASLLWLKEHEPASLDEAYGILCPKDWLRLKITGAFGAEAVDASSTGVFSIAQRDWAWDLIDLAGLPRRLFPEVFESTDIAGSVSRACHEETGLPEGIPVIYGAGDQPAQAIGNGIWREGRLTSNIGTGGQVSAFIRKPLVDPGMRTNTFCHAIERGYTIFGATLCSGMSMNWAKNKVFCVDSYAEINAKAASVPAGSDGLLYLPYLSGERTPYMDPDARGMFFGMTLAHEQRHFLRAVMEGVTFGLRDCMEILLSLGIDADTIIASGGGAASPLWLQIQADILKRPIRVSTVSEQACLGACILAGVGTGIFSGVEEACGRFVTMSDAVWEPIPENSAIYDERYEVFKKLYAQTKDLMHQ